MSYDLMGNLARTAAGSGKFVNFKTIGQWATIEVLRGRDWKAPKANKDGSYDEAPALDGRYVAGNIPDMAPGQDATLILSGHKGTAVMEAVAAAGVSQVTYPFTLTVGFTHEQDTGEIQPMKRYQAKVEFPPQAQAANPFGGNVPVPIPGAQAPQPPQSAPPAPFGAPSAPAAPQYAPQPPAAAGGPAPAPPYAMVDGQWVGPDDPRYPGPPPPEAPSPFAGAPAPAEGQQGNGMGRLFQ